MTSVDDDLAEGERRAIVSIQNPPSQLHFLAMCYAKHPAVYAWCQLKPGHDGPHVHKGFQPRRMTEDVVWT